MLETGLFERHLSAACLKHRHTRTRLDDADPGDASVSTLRYQPALDWGAVNSV